MLDETLVLVTADHGGLGNGHGMNNPACAFVPAVFWGAGVSGSRGPAMANGDSGFFPYQKIDHHLVAIVFFIDKVG